MPTIDQLAPATAAADSDELPIYQSGASRKVTRAQLLAGMQVGLAVRPGTLLGRSSTGIGAPEPIGIGSNLTLSGGQLSAPPPFRTASLPPGQPPRATDLVPVGQSGSDAAVAYGPFLGGLSGLSGIDLSRHVVQAAGGTAPRTLADTLSDVVAIESFGAVGDGVTDCTDAINRALAAGHPIRFGPRTYLLRGQCTIGVAADLVGVAGQTVLRRPTPSTQDGGAWISIQGPTFTARGITFDANQHPTESWAVLVTADCGRALFQDCMFANATGASLGCGLTILPNTAATDHAVLGCRFSNNAVHGVWVRATTGMRIAGCTAHHNGGYGICVDDDDPALARQVRNALVTGNTCWSNNRGISVGNFNQTNGQPPVWGNANPDVIGAVVSGNTCFGNTAYGIALAGQALLATGNLLTGNGPDGAGILFNASQSRLDDNIVVALAGSFGIDAGGSVDCDILGNAVSGASVGINAGGSQRVRVVGNRLDGNVWGIAAYNVETDGQGNDFGQGTTALTIRANRITFASRSGGGITLIDGPQTVMVADNEFFGIADADIAQCLSAHTDSAVIRNNTWNNATGQVVNPATVAGIQQIAIPDILDDVVVTSAPAGVQSITTRHAVDVAGQVTFIRVSAGGTGYTAAKVAIAGKGNGAGAIAYVRDGAVVGIAVTTPGSGYDATTVVTVTGDGFGAAATAQAGLAMLEDRRLRMQCRCGTRFDRAAAIPALDNWTQAGLTVPAGSSIAWTVAGGTWQATDFALGEFLAPATDGGLVLRTLSGGDLVLRPSGLGAIRFGNETSGGCTVSVGHGSPDGVVAAPPGSDYRNLDGGAGTTLWIKRTGTDAHGWAAVA